MTDIVERLRSVPAVSYADCRDAADEIERLRAERDALRADLTLATDELGNIERAPLKNFDMSYAEFMYWAQNRARHTLATIQKHSQAKEPLP